MDKQRTEQGILGGAQQDHIRIRTFEIFQYFTPLAVLGFSEVQTKQELSLSTADRQY